MFFASCSCLSLRLVCQVRIHMSVREVSCVWLCWPRAVQITSAPSRLFSTISKRMNEQPVQCLIFVYVCLGCCHPCFRQCVAVCRTITRWSVVLHSLPSDSFLNTCRSDWNVKTFFLSIFYAFYDYSIVCFEFKIGCCVSYSQMSVNSMLSWCHCCMDTCLQWIRPKSDTWQRPSMPWRTS